MILSGLFFRTKPGPGFPGPGFLALNVLFDRLKRLIANHMFDPAGVFNGSYPVYAQVDEYIRQNRVPLVDLFRNLAACFRKREEAVLIGCHIAAIFHKTHGTADTGLGISHIFTHIHDIEKQQG